MSKDKRTGWIADLKEGDKVGLRRRFERRYDIAVVEAISATGQVTCCYKQPSGYVDRVRFTPGGSRIGGDGGPIIPLDIAEREIRKMAAEARLSKMVVASGRPRPVRLHHLDAGQLTKDLGPLYGAYLQAQKALADAIQEACQPKHEKENA